MRAEIRGSRPPDPRGSCFRSRRRTTGRTGSQSPPARSQLDRVEAEMHDARPGVFAGRHVGHRLHRNFRDRRRRLRRDRRKDVRMRRRRRRSRGERDRRRRSRCSCRCVNRGHRRPPGDREPATGIAGATDGIDGSDGAMNMPPQLGHLIICPACWSAIANFF